MVRTILAGALLWAALPAQTWAWGGEGHRIVAAVAQAQLLPGVRLEVDQLLALEPGATLESISTWADEVRSPATARWHYVNIERQAACSYSTQRDCADGQCVVEAIRRQSAVLSSSAPSQARLQALKYLIHLVADVHQPLHAGFASDRGGNEYQVHVAGRGTNLHALWDSGLIDAWPGGVQELRLSAVRQTASLPAITAIEPEQWAEESCRIVTSADFYPAGHKVDAAYTARWMRVLPDRLAPAGQRLAALLNATMTHPTRHPQ